MSHTPGPWTLERHGLRTDVVLTGHPTHTACTVCSIHPEDDNDPAIRMADANAQLIAAAPELLAGGHKAIVWMEQASETNDHAKSALAFMRAAISKASGSSKGGSNPQEQLRNPGLEKALDEQRVALWRAQALMDCVKAGLEGHFGSDWPAAVPHFPMALELCSQSINDATGALQLEVLIDRAKEIAEEEAQS